MNSFNKTEAAIFPMQTMLWYLPFSDYLSYFTTADVL